MNNEVNAKELLNDSTIQKEKKSIYLVFFLMGIISFPIGFILSISLRSMINIEWIWQFLLFPLLICSIFFAIGLAAFKKQPHAHFSLKAFVASFAGMFLILILVGPALLYLFGPQQDASTSASISLESSAENFTIYIPVLLDENKTVLKMYENPMITGSTTTSLIDTEHGKALKITKSGLGNYVFNWNEVPGKDNDRFVKWIDNVENKLPGEKLDITKTDNGTTITVLGNILGSITASGRSNLIIRLNEENIFKFYNIRDNETGGFIGEESFFTKKENGQLNIYAGESGNYLFNWNEVPGKDTDRFVKWIQGEGHVQPGEKLDISKTNDVRTITVSGTGIWTYRLNENGGLEFHGVTKNIEQEISGWPLFFAKMENGNLNIYSGNNEISMNENHEKLKDDKLTSDEFFREFTISMSNYTSPEHFIDMPYNEYDSKFGAWVYSDSEIEKFSFSFGIDPRTNLYESNMGSAGIALSISPQGWWVHLRKRWQVVNLSRGKIAWDAVRTPTTG